MKVKKNVNKLLAWVLTVIILMTTGLGAWANETAAEPQPVVQEEPESLTEEETDKTKVAESLEEETNKTEETQLAAKDETDKAREETDKAREETDKAKEETDKAKEETDKAKEETEKIEETQSLAEEEIQTEEKNAAQKSLSRSGEKDVTSYLDEHNFITLIRLTNLTKNHIILEENAGGTLINGTDVENDVNDFLEFCLNFALNDEDVNINEGDYAYIDLPSALKWPTGANSEAQIIDDNGEKLCDISIVTESDGSQKLKIIFTDYFSTHIEASGQITMNLNFNPDNIDQNSSEFKFEFSGISVAQNLIVNKGKATLEKQATSWGWYYKMMTWTLIVDSTGTSTSEEYYIEDILSEGQYLNQSNGTYANLTMGTIQIPYAPIEDTSTIPRYHYIEGMDGEPNKIIIYPGALNNEKASIVYTTHVDESWLLESGYSEKSGDAYMNISNEATFYSGSDEKIASAEESYETSLGVIKKSITDASNGSISWANETLKWSIDINSGNFSLTDIVVTDSIHKDLFVDQEILNALFDGKAVVEGTDGSSTPYYKVVGVDPEDSDRYIVEFHLGKSGSKTLTFETKYSSAIFGSTDDSVRTNKVYINGIDKSGNEIPPYYSETTIQVSSSDLQKFTVSTDQQTGEITWRIILNGNASATAYYDMESLVLKDTIKDCMELVPGSVKYYSKKAGSSEYQIPEDQTGFYQDAAGNTWKYVEVDSNDPYEGGTFTLIFNTAYLDEEVSTGNEGYAFILEYKTLCDPTTFKVADNDENFNFIWRRNNYVYIEGVNSNGSKVENSAFSPANMQALSVTKTGEFDENKNFTLPADEKFIHWKVTYNSQLMDLMSPAIKDPIPDGLLYTEGSVTVGYSENTWSTPIPLPQYDSNGEANYIVLYNPAEGDNGTLTVVIDETKLPDYGDKYYRFCIEFDTTFKNPEETLLTSGEVDFTNTVYATHAEISEYEDGMPTSLDTGKWLEADATVTLTNEIVEKSAVYDRENPAIISWYVDINDQGMGLTNVFLEDVLQTGLELDMSDGSIAVYKLEYNNTTNQLVDGSLLPKEENGVLNYSLTYNHSTNTFRFQFEGDLKTTGLDGAYRLYFKTYVNKEELGAETTINNQVVFNGGGSEINSNSEAVELNIAGISTSGSGSYGSFSIYKYEKDNESKPLAGAVFELYDSNKDLITTLDATDTEGKVTYNKLRYNTQYYIKEVTAPTGYVLEDTTFYPVVLANSSEEVVIEVANEQISVNGNLEISKMVEGVPVDTDKEFSFTVTLTDESGTPLTQTFEYEGTGEKADGTITNGDEITLKHGQSIIISNIPAGSKYQVKETNTAGYVVTPDTGICEGSIEEDAVAKATFINTAVSELTISKTVTGTAGSQTEEFTFIVTLTDADDEKLPGTYSYTGSKDGSILSGGSITLKHGESITITGLPLGTGYTVEESGSIGYMVTPEGGKAEGIITTENAEAAFTNHKDADDISEPDIADENENEDENINMIDEVIEIGISKVNSKGTELAGAALIIYEANTDGNATGVIAKDKDGNELSWITTEEPKEITGMIAGTYILHEEAAPQGYYVADDILFTVNDDGTVTKDSASGHINGNTIIMTDFEYEEVMPVRVSLAIEKTVSGTAGNTDQEFTFTLKLTDEGGEEVIESFSYEGSKTGTIKSGESVKLKHGEYINIQDIPLGVRYEVIESDNEGYTVTEKNTAGTIDEVGRTAHFTNHKDQSEAGGENSIKTSTTPQVESSANNNKTSTTPQVESSANNNKTSTTPQVKSSANNNKTSTTPQVKSSANNNKTNSSQSKTLTTIKTADTTNWFVWIILCASCVFIIGGLILLKKRKY